MPILDYDGDSFVAFVDISGFKEMMRSGERRAVNAIDCFYTAGFNALEPEPTINGFFVSDCGILFSRQGDEGPQLEGLLRVVKQLNRSLLAHDLMLTTSIARGHFKYHNRIEFPGINKQPIFGNAYLAAFLDNEGGKPRIQPGQCRILAPTGNIPQIAQSPFLERTANHYYFYWSVERPNDIPQFKQRYQDSYNRKYSGMLSALREH